MPPFPLPLPSDVKTWPGITRAARTPIAARPIQISAYFAPLQISANRQAHSQTAFDGVSAYRRSCLWRRQEPRQPNAAESAIQESDRRVMRVLRYRLGPVGTELKGKFKRFSMNAKVRVCFIVCRVDGLTVVQEVYDFEAVLFALRPAPTPAADMGGAPTTGATGPDATGVSDALPSVWVLCERWKL